MTRRESLKSVLGLAMLPSTNGLNLSSLWSTIKVRSIPSSGESLPVVGVGTWRTFDVGSSGQARAPLEKVLEKLLAHGGSVIDSSPMYGRSEEVVGDLATKLNRVNKLFMATKVWTSGRQAGIDQMNRSMDRMQKRPMDLMQIHNLVDWKTHIKTLQSWKQSGRIRYIGITHYIESAYDEMMHIMKNYPLDFIQLNYSVTSRAAENKILPLALEKGIAVIINRPYEGGSLFRKVNGQALPGWASEFDCNSWGQFFLKYILSHPAVTCVIPGTSNPRHMVDNLGAGLGRLPSARERQQVINFLKDQF